jgi:hypothetical protein
LDERSHGPRLRKELPLTPHYAAVLLAVSALALLDAIPRPTRTLHAAEGQRRREDLPKLTPYGVSGSPLKALSADAVAKIPALNDFLKVLVAKGNKQIVFTIKEPVYQISSDALAMLFPKWTFYIVSFTEEKHPNYKGDINIAFGLYYVVGVNDRGERVEFWAHNNHEEFGRFLASHGVRLRNADEARQIWTAYCHLHRQGWPKWEPRKEGPTLWHLGVQVANEREYYYEVRTNEDGTVLSGQVQTRPPPKKSGK